MPYRGTADVNSARLVVDMSNKLTLLKPSQSPLTALLQNLRKQSCMNYKFEWLEDDLMGRWISENGGSLAADTAIELQTGEGSLVAIDDLVKVVASGEIMRVTAVTGDTLTVVRGYGETSAADIAADAKMVIIGNASEQGSGASAEKYNNMTNAYNYTQIIKTPFSVTNTLDAMKLYGKDELARLRMNKGIEHNKSIEFALIFGERKLDTSGAEPLSTTGGVLKWLTGTDNVTTLDRSVTTTTAGQKASLDSWIQDLFTYGSDTKVWLCSPKMITFVNTLADDKIRLIQADNDNTFGLQIMTYQTPHGRLQMVHHPMLVQGYADYSFALDMEQLQYRYLEGRDTQLKTNIQANDEDGRRDMYITEMGLEFQHPKMHGMFICQN